MKGTVLPSGHILWHLKRRMPDGSLQSCHLLIEKATSIVVSEKCSKGANNTPGAPGGSPEHLQRLGIPFEAKVLDDGREVLEVQPQKASPRTQRIMRFFRTSEPCDFPGCEELRERYAADMAKLPPNCPKCEQGGVMRKYMALLAEII